MIALVIMGLVFVLNVVQLCLIAGVSGSQEMLSTMLHSLGEETEQGTEQGTEPVENISEPPLPGESETGEQSTESWLDVFGIEIRKPPTSSPVDLSGGMNSGIHKMLFTIEAAGEDVQNFEFHWQRYNEETGRWEDINEDNAYSVSNTIKDGVTAYSALYLERVTDNVIGEYRCLVENSKGYQIPSDSAVLSPMNAASEEGTEPTEHEKVPNGSWGGKN